jgi:hypothetical protein
MKGAFAIIGAARALAGIQPKTREAWLEGGKHE